MPAHDVRSWRLVSAPPLAEVLDQAAELLVERGAQRLEPIDERNERRDRAA
jgi:hypothetical protein